MKNSSLPLKNYELQNRKVIPIFRTTKGFQLTFGLGDVAIFRVTSSWDMLPIKDMKIKIYSKAGLYSSVGYVAE